MSTNLYSSTLTCRFSRQLTTHSAATRDAEITSLNWQKCRCEICPGVYCHSGATLDPNSCKCKPQSSPPSAPPSSPPTRPPVCPSPKVYVPSRRRCVCPSDSCSSGQTLNPNTCECVCIGQSQCNSLRWINSDTCKCECVEVIPRPVQVTRLTKTQDEDTTDTQTRAEVETAMKAQVERTAALESRVERAAALEAQVERAATMEHFEGSNLCHGSSRKRRAEWEGMDPQLAAMSGPGRRL